MWSIDNTKGPIERGQLQKVWDEHWKFAFSDKIYDGESAWKALRSSAIEIQDINKLTRAIIWRVLKCKDEWYYATEKTVASRMARSLWVQTSVSSILVWLWMNKVEVQEIVDWWAAIAREKTLKTMHTSIDKSDKENNL
jgi:hypothetical protein